MKLISKILLTLFCVMGTAAIAQDTRATITGRVADSTGAVVPNAKIIAKSQDTGVTTTTTTSGEGVYTIPFLQPGLYTISVSAPGFSTYTRKGVQLQTADHLGIDLPLVAGGTSTEVTVTSNAPLIQLATATASQVLTPGEIENLPDNGRSPMALAKTEYAVVPKQKNSVVQGRPFDNSAVSDFSIGGGNSQSNEYLLNGIVNMQNSSRLVAFSPFMDATSEIRVDTFQMDASYGDTSGGTVTMTTKSGTNQFHGTLSEFNQFSAINAPLRWFAGTAKQPATRQNQYGGTIGGPVWIPKVFNGHDKLFFFYAYEHFKDSTPNATPYTVPETINGHDERVGDFGGLVALGCPVAHPITGDNLHCGDGTINTYQLYNPYSGSTTRTPILNNDLRNLAGHPLNATGVAYLNFFPQPNNVANQTVDGQNNYISTFPTLNNYNSHEGRLDYTLNDSNKFAFEIHRSEYFATPTKAFGNISTGQVNYTVHQGGFLDYIHTFTPSMTLDTRAGMTRTYPNGQIASAGFDATSIGFQGYMNSTPAAARLLPTIKFSDSTVPQLGTSAATNNPFDEIQFYSAFTAVRGRHTVKLGIDIRTNKLSYLNVGSSTNVALPNGSNPVASGFTSGYFALGGTGSGLNSTPTAAAPKFGGSLAALELGLPTSGQININPQPSYSSWYFGGFIQDDWRLSPFLTLDLGMRFESETSIVEAHNKGVFFDPKASNGVASAAASAYALAPDPRLPAASFNANGGLQFLGVNGNRRSEFNTQKVYPSPRIGLSFNPPMFHEKLVIRTGYGLFFNPYNDYYTPQAYGFSSVTQFNYSNDGGATPATTINDPFPTGSNPIQQPSGSALGANTFLGTPIQVRPTNIKAGYSQRWNLDVQFQISANMMFQVGYIGNHQTDGPFTNAIGAIPVLPYLSRAPYNDSVAQALASSTGATNPFYNLPNITGPLHTNPKISPYQLLQAYPQFAGTAGSIGVTQQLTPGASALFHELAARFQKRSSYGLTSSVNFEWSHNLSTSQLNPGDKLTYQENASDFPIHIAITNVYALPIGKGKTFFGNANNLLDNLIGGWTVNNLYQYLSGAYINWGTAPNFHGQTYDPRFKIINGRGVGGAFDTTLFDTTPAGQPNATYNYRTFPQNFGRQDATNNLDASILKDFHYKGVKMQYRFEAFNVLNHTQFGTPIISPTASNFGQINTQANVPRRLQQGIRLVF